MSATFHGALTRRLASDLLRQQTGNLDRLRFPAMGGSLLARFKGLATELLDRALARAGCTRHNAYHRVCIEQGWDAVQAHLPGLDWLYHRLADDTSRRTLVEVIAFRILGSRHTRLSRNDAAYARALRRLFHETMKHPRAARAAILDGWLDDYTVAMVEGPVHLRAHKLNVLNTFLLEQYRFTADGVPPVQVEPGDVVVDGGGCWGDTALYFAGKAGAEGQVHVFEFSADNLAILHANLDANPGLKSRVHVHREALWDVSGQHLRFAEHGPATALSLSDADGEGAGAVTRTIDDWARTTGVDRVDFIKLDVEGAEARCLRGAKQTIRAHKPRLAVALYHALGDFTELPQLVDDIAPGYRLHLGHYTIHEEETILFAMPAA